MKRQEAYKILELSQDASEEEVQAAFRKMAKKYHPDKKDGDEAKFKEINEAYQILTNKSNSSPDFDPDDMMGGFGGFNINFGPFGNPFGGFHPRVQKEHENILINISLTFNESVLGCDKEIKYTHKAMCNDCHGNGFINLSDKCDECNGKGNRTIKQKNMVFMTSCGKCGGSGKKMENCAKCKDGSVDSNATINVKIPGGILNNQKIRLAGVGNFVAPGFSTDVLLNAFVEKDEDMHLEGNDVISEIKISLLEALKGASKKVRTVKGEHILKIPPKIRNGEKLSVAKYGANNGDHIFKLDVKYPDDVSKIINVLEE